MRSLSPMSRKMVIHSLVEQESSLPKWLQIGKVSPINYIQMLSRQVHARHKSCKIWLSGMRNFFPQMICLMSTVNCIHFGSNHHFTYTADVSLTSKFRSPALIGKQNRGLSLATASETRTEPCWRENRPPPPRPDIPGAFLVNTRRTKPTFEERASCFPVRLPHRRNIASSQRRFLPSCLNDCHSCRDYPTSRQNGTSIDDKPR